MKWTAKSRPVVIDVVRAHRNLLPTGAWISLRGYRM
jgi:hypothetical protein